MKVNKWKMNRAGLVNFWYYDEETFSFSNGKLLLRGSNGSGKSVTMQSFLPVLLDGKKSPERLDPFGSRARRMEDYLLGEADVTGRDERTGYLFIEYKREDTNQYVTTGIGLKAKRHKSIDFWGFIITDQRRIGHDISLTKETRNAGMTQRIPLSKKELEDRIGDGGRIVSSQKEYMDLVNKHVFGFESLEAYDDLIKLLIQLRSPKLSKDFKPTVIYGILEGSLPEIGDEELRPLSETIENMDQTRDQLDQLQRDKESINLLCRFYKQYNDYFLAEKALEFQNSVQDFQNKVVEQAALSGKIEDMKVEYQKVVKLTQELENEKEVLEESKHQLQQHEVFNAEQEKHSTEQRIVEWQKEYRQKRENADLKLKKERELKSELQTYKDTLLQEEQKIAEILDELSEESEASFFTAHDQNATDFKRGQSQKFEFAVWRKEADYHRATLRKILDQWQDYNREQLRFEDTSRYFADSQKRLDESRRNRDKWRALFEEEREVLLESFHSWNEKYRPFFSSNKEELQQLSQYITNLYQPFTYQDIHTVISSKYHEKQKQFSEEEIHVKNSILKATEEIDHLMNELHEWRERKDPEPTRHPLTMEARRLMVQNGIDFLPLYKAVDFKEDVTDETRERIESALLDAGLLDALITHQESNVFHDKILKPAKQEAKRSLLRFLTPDVPDSSNISEKRIRAILTSIEYSEKVSEQTESHTVIRSNGRYQIGPIEGHAPNREHAVFIGSRARERFRENRINELTENVAQLDAYLDTLRHSLKTIKTQTEKLKDGFTSFPSDEHVLEAFQVWQNTIRVVQEDEKEVELRNEAMKKALISWEVARKQLLNLTKGMAVEFTESAYKKAYSAFDEYQSFLTKLQFSYTASKEVQRHIQSCQDRIIEMQEDLDLLDGDMNVLESRIEREYLRLKKLEDQLIELGAEEIRRKINETVGRLKEIELRLPKVIREGAKLQAEMESCENHYRKQARLLVYYESLVSLWREAFLEEWKFDKDQELTDTCPEELAEKLVKEFSGLLKKETRESVGAKLTQAFYSQQQVLVEYRLSEETRRVETLSFPDMRDIPEDIAFKFQSFGERRNRTVLLMEFKGQRVSPFYVMGEIEKDILLQKDVLNETDKELYEEIILNSVGRIIRGKIQRAERWVKKINALMEKRDSSSGLTFSIKWRPRTADAEEEMDTKDLVDLLRTDPRLLKEEDMNRVTGHFRSKISRARELSASSGFGTTLHQVIKEILDYRKWFGFTLYYKRERENKRELTNHVFFTFSGGEKAMAMYIPLFSAVYSRYQEASNDAPFIITLDEAFAGVDENNIRDMFGLVEELQFNYIMNSQALWGDYETVSSLSICELIRPKNAPYVSVVRYIWNGVVRMLHTEELS
ncbi:TIGR02680 family protein [Bacillus massilinigeriensis]|uniref:TIGR02680 family protein n=1 Tax=Bacillus mediterraneensis TaxID=1805474 RepID=UPI0008F7EBA5|nr:TIGR02680 family protein [Bacillus mediterraneensis]